MFCYVNSVLLPQIKRNKRLENNQLQDLGGITLNEFVYLAGENIFFSKLFFFFLQISTYRIIELFKLLNFCLLCFRLFFFSLK